MKRGTYRTGHVLFAVIVLCTAVFFGGLRSGRIRRFV